MKLAPSLLALLCAIAVPGLARGQADGLLCGGSFNAGGGTVVSDAGQQMIATMGEALTGSPAPTPAAPGILEAGHLSVDCASDLVVAVDDGPAPSRLVFDLEPARPNPFNPRTEIAFVLPEEGTARLQLFDAAGRHVATLLDRRMSAGRHTLGWSGEGRASGVYYLRLQTANATRVRSLVLVK